MNHPPELILASASPRRHELLSGAGIQFTIQPSTVEEKVRPNETPEELVQRLALEKARDVARHYSHSENSWILGADTIVVIDGEVLGKPSSEDHAVELLQKILGKTHRVLTGFSLVHSSRESFETAFVESQVSMRTASCEEIQEYIRTGEPMDKAGAYAVQGVGSKFITGVQGSRSNVIGLPLEETLERLRQVGIQPSVSP